jgi:hypothetical protein
MDSRFVAAITLTLDPPTFNLTVSDCVAHYLPKPKPLDARVRQILNHIEKEGESSLENSTDNAVTPAASMGPLGRYESLPTLLYSMRMQ